MDLLGIIFDLDGVLCRTDEYHYAAWKLLADRIGIPFSRADNAGLRGVSRMQSLELLLARSPRGFSESEKQALAEEKNAAYRSMLSALTPADADPEVLSTLRSLRRCGLRLAVGSSSRNAKIILERLALNPYFDAVADGTEIRNSKPDPEVFLLAAFKLSLPPSRLAVVEDAPAGILAAKRGGFYAFGIGDASGDPLTDRSIGSLSELVPLCV